MTCKLINKTTQEEHLCSKVVIGGFDYYVNDETGNLNDFVSNGIAVAQVNVLTIDDPNKHLHKKVIATNNPNIDLPQVIDDFEELAKQSYQNHIPKYELTLDEKIQRTGGYNVGFKDGYNNSQKTHSFSEDDVIEFGLFCVNFAFSDGKDKTTKELLEVWKKQQSEIIYFN